MRATILALLLVPRLLAAQQAVAITNVTVVDVERGVHLPARTVVIEGDRIATVRPSATLRVPPGARVIDGRGRYLIPGLVDTHVHTGWGAGANPDTLSLFRWLLANGITSVREASGVGRERELVALRDRISRGELLAPRLYVSGTASVRNVGRYQATDLRDLVHRLAALGVDGIKVIHLARDEAVAAIDEARRIGIPVYGHTHVVGGMQRPDLPFGLSAYALDAVRAGLTGMMHATSATPVPDWPQEGPPADATPQARGEHFDAWWTRALEGWLRRPPAEEQALIDTMRARGVWLEPTLIVEDVYAHPERYRGHPGEATAGTSVREWWGVRDDTSAQRRRATALARVESFVRRFHDAGGLVLAGTDGAPLPGFGLHDELALLVKAGLSPAQALRAATLNPARAFGREARLGTVASGKLADLVLLDGDPLADVRNTRRIRLVVANGRVLDRPALDGLLSARTRVAAPPTS